MTVDPAADRPLFKQLADLLREQIQSGELAPGRTLPSETTLRERYGISRDTVRDAVAVLRSEGLVITEPRRGSYVREAVEPSTVHVAAGARITARMPSMNERRRLDIGEGVPVLIVARSGQPEEVHPADRTALEVDET